MSVTPEQRNRLLRQLKIGHDLLAACDEAGVDPALVRADAELLAACEAAFATATSKLRSRLTEKVLSRQHGADISTLERGIADRAALQREQFRVPENASGAPDLSGLSVFELELLEAALRCDFVKFTRVVEERVKARVAEEMRAERRKLAEDARPRPIEELLELDETRPIPRNKAMDLPIRAIR